MVKWVRNSKERSPHVISLAFLSHFAISVLSPLALQVHIYISLRYMFAYASVDALQRYRGPDIVLHYVSNLIANASGRSGGLFLSNVPRWQILVESESNHSIPTSQPSLRY